jgi:hypothetical protein
MGTYVVALALGIAAVLIGTVLGGAGPLLDAVVAPPLIVRAALVGASAVVALALLGRAVTALGGGEAPEREMRDGRAMPADRDMPTMIRGVRLAFLAVAAAAASAGWFVGHPLLLVVALVIAGVDIVETTFLLIVARRHRIDEPEG